MAAPLGNQNAVGNRGGGTKSHQNRQIAAEVRNLALEHIKRVLERPIVEMSLSEYEFYKAILLRLAPSLLPRLTEITGDDGAPIVIENETQAQVNEALLRFIKQNEAPAA
jgi:hypothetical protein